MNLYQIEFKIRFSRVNNYFNSFAVSLRNFGLIVLLFAGLPFPQPSESVKLARQQPGSVPLTFDYHDYEEMTAWLRRTNSVYPELTALYSIGKSVQGK